MDWLLYAVIFWTGLAVGLLLAWQPYRLQLPWRRLTDEEMKAKEPPQEVPA